MLKIRYMRNEDIEKVVYYENLLFGQSLGHDMIYKEINDNTLAYYFVLEKNYQVIGYCGSWFTDPNSQIINFFIIPEFQGQKLGEFLLDYVISFLKEKGANLITLEVRVSNTIAQNLYTKKGFEKTFIRNNYYQDGEDALMMIKYL